MCASDRRNRHRRIVLALIALAAPAAALTNVLCAPAYAGNPNDPVAESFDRLKTLRGEWTSEGPRRHKGGPGGDHGAVRLIYETIADGTVLIEHWHVGPDRRTMTVYFRDGAQLMATHYCFQGNQPRLVLTEVLPNGRMNFAYKDATNLPSLAIPHLAALWFEMPDRDHLLRGETYQSAMGPDVSKMHFRRVR